MTDRFHAPARRVRAVLTAALVATLLGGCALFSPKPPDAVLDEAELRTVVEALAALDPPRNFEHVDSLDRAAASIHRRFSAHGYTPT